MTNGRWLIHCAIGIMVLSGCGQPNIGIQNGKLKPCPASPNCVSSDETDASHHVDPLVYSGTREKARETVLSILDLMSGVRVVQSTNDYIHAEFRSKIFHFVDDVEFFFPEDAQVIHMRSASRIGYSDFGVNKKRIKEIRRLFNEKTGQDVKK